MPSLQNLKKLNELDLSLTSITSNSSPVFSNMILFQNLRKLDLSATKMSDEGIHAIASAKNKINLGLHSNVSSVSEIHNTTNAFGQAQDQKCYCASLDDRPAETSCLPLEELRIRHIEFLSLRTLESLSKNARKLRVLDIGYSVEFLSTTPRDIKWSSNWARVVKEFRKNGTEVCREEAIIS